VAVHPYQVLPTNPLRPLPQGVVRLRRQHALSPYVAGYFLGRSGGPGASGKIFDYSKNASHAIIGGNNTIAKTTQDFAIECDGTWPGSYSVASRSGVGSAYETQPGACVFWVRVRSVLGGYNNVLGNNGSGSFGNRGITFATDGSSRFVLDFRDTSNTPVTELVGPALVANKWTCVAGKWNTSTTSASLFVNGYKVASTTSMGSWSYDGAGGGIVFGKGSNNDWNLNGWINNVIWFNTEPSDAQLASFAFDPFQLLESEVGELPLHVSVASAPSMQSLADTLTWSHNVALPSGQVDWADTLGWTDSLQIEGFGDDILWSDAFTVEGVANVVSLSDTVTWSQVQEPDPQLSDTLTWSESTRLSILYVNLATLDTCLKRVLGPSDAQLLNAAFGKSEGEEGYDPNFDLNGDGTIDSIDLFALVAGALTACEDTDTLYWHDEFRPDSSDLANSRYRR
jgi:hypothetical protein